MIVNCVDHQWRGALASVLYEGAESAPRGLKIKEVLGLQTRVDLARATLTVPGRRLGYRFLAAEAAWILSGDDRVETIVPYSKVIERFSDDGRTFFGAYGPKVVEQLEYVVRTLQADPDSRQAVLNIWRENPPAGVRDVPCTLSLQFLRRSEHLHVHATMRSSDLWLGWPYDVFNFAAIGLYVTQRLCEAGLVTRPGTLILTAGSAHLYERDWASATGCLQGPDQGAQLFEYAAAYPSVNLPSSADLVEHLWAIARRDRSGLRGTWLSELLDLGTRAGS